MGAPLEGALHVHGPAAAPPAEVERQRHQRDLGAHGWLHLPPTGGGTSTGGACMWHTQAASGQEAKQRRRPDVAIYTPSKPVYSEVHLVTVQTLTLLPTVLLDCDCSFGSARYRHPGAGYNPRLSADG